jgi:hypothetical protein
MRIYRAEYKDRDGQQKKAAKWYLDFSDHNQLRHKIPAFADKRLSEALGRNIESLVNCRIAGLELDVKLNQWIETVPDSLLKKFVSWGLIEGQRNISDILKTGSKRLLTIAAFVSLGILQKVQLKFILESSLMMEQAKQPPDIILIA